MDVSQSPPGVADVMNAVKPKIRWMFILLIYVSLEGLSYLGLRVLETRFNLPYDPRVAALSKEQKEKLTKFLASKKGERNSPDPMVGWVPVAHVNAAGMRDDRDYETVAPPGSIRISAFGDSFTYGADVELHESWAKQLTSRRPYLEVLNYGVGAYGLDQAYLRYRQVGTDYHPHIVFIGYMSENIARSVNVFRAFYTRAYRNVIFTKPRFAVVDGKLDLLNNPLSSMEDYQRFLSHDREVLIEIGRNDFHYQNNYGRGPFDVLPSVRLAKMAWYAINKNFLNPIFRFDGSYNEQSEAYDVTVRVFEAFYRNVLENHALPIVVIFPDLHDQQRSRAGKPRRYAALLTDLHAKGYRVIDAMDALQPYESQYAVEDLVMPTWGHYSPLGNSIMAAYLAESLERMGVTEPSLLENVIRAERERLNVAAR